MAAPSKTNPLRRFMFFMLFILPVSIAALIDVGNSSISSNSSLNGDLSPDERDRSSVKKELRNPDKWSGTGVAEEEEVEPIKGLYLDEGAQMLASFLRTVSNKELGVTALQSIYDSLPFGVVERDDVSRVKELSERLQRKLSHYWGLVNHSRIAIEELFWHHLHRPLHNAVPCCELPDSIMRYFLIYSLYYLHMSVICFLLNFYRFNTHFGAAVSNELGCDVGAFKNHSPSSFIPGHNLTDSIYCPIIFDNFKY